MAKRKGNKSAKIREILIENPETGPTEVVRQLKALGIEATTGLVGQIKSKMKAKSSVAKTPSTTPRAAQTTDDGQDDNFSTAAIKDISGVIKTHGKEKVAALLKLLG
jgi:hypothetical protein